MFEFLTVMFEFLTVKVYYKNVKRKINKCFGEQVMIYAEA